MLKKFFLLIKLDKSDRIYHINLQDQENLAMYMYLGLYMTQQSQLWGRKVSKTSLFQLQNRIPPHPPTNQQSQNNCKALER